jgi:hypothetical protein
MVCPKFYAHKRSFYTLTTTDMRDSLFRRTAAICVCALTITAAQASNEASTASSTPWYSTAWQHAKDTWREGDVEAYVPFWSYHLPFAYSAEKRAEYVEYPAGFGLGKGRYNKSGNWEGMYAMGFRDSHGEPSFMVGYAWVPTWNIGKSEVKAGVGLTGFLMSRRHSLPGRFTCGLDRLQKPVSASRLHPRWPRVWQCFVHVGQVDV